MKIGILVKFFCEILNKFDFWQLSSTKSGIVMGQRDGVVEKFAVGGIKMSNTKRKAASLLSPLLCT
jgi:hypothetical protein